MSRLQLATNTDELDDLHRALDGSRESSEFVKVSRKALSNILVDHGRLVGLHQNKVQEAEIEA